MLSSGEKRLMDQEEFVTKCLQHLKTTRLTVDTLQNITGDKPQFSEVKGNERVHGGSVEGKASHPL